MIFSITQKRVPLRLTCNSHSEGASSIKHQLMDEMYNITHLTPIYHSRLNWRMCYSKTETNDGFLALRMSDQGPLQGGSMGAIAPIDFEKCLFAPINF